MEEIKHFDHQHSLSLSNKTTADNISCWGCFKRCDGPTYICSRKECRKYALHESCAKLPEEVQSPFHPPHPLTLQLCHDSHNSKCDGCDRNGLEHFVYRCNECNFKLDLDCAFMRLVKVNVNEEGQFHTHPYHNHPLLLFEKVPKWKYQCTVCINDLSDSQPTYGCIPCRLFLHHGSCFDDRNFPPQVRHYYHPHPLTLSTTTQSHQQTICDCEACDLQLRMNNWYYSCQQCKDFVMDIKCTLLPTTVDIKSESEEQIQHFLHGHLLSLCKNLDDLEVNCFVCRKGCKGTTTYGCPRGWYCKQTYFHKSCLELQQKICHPFHPYHPLTLTRLKKSKICNACRNSTVSVAYICQDDNCDFHLHTECATPMKAAMTYEGHNHLLQFTECTTPMKAAMTNEGHSHLLQFKDDNIVNKELKCSACKFKISESYAFTCLYCDLNLHLLCGPLPYTIQHQDHNMHPLFLTNSPVQEEVEDETDEFYCHACEEERDPLLAVYYCAECQFVAEIKCILPQIILSLKEEYGDIELRNTLGHPGKLISAKAAKEMCQNKFEQFKQTSTLSDILGSSRKDVIEELSNVFMAMKAITSEEDGQYQDCKYSEDFLFSDEFYTQFMKFLDRGKGIDSWKTREEFVNIGDYIVPLRLATILKQLFSKHGDVSAKSTLSPMDSGQYKDCEYKDGEYSQDFLLSNKAYTQFMKFLDSGKGILDPWDTPEEFVNVGDYIVPLRLATILEQLFSKHGDVSAKSTLSPMDSSQYKDCAYSEDFLLSDKAYTQFMKFLDSGKGILDPWETPEEFVNVGGYIVPLRLAAILKQLLYKHGDVSAKSTLRPMAKLYLFIVLCECIYSMANTKVVDITKDLLLNWWTSFKMLQSARFEIQFAFDHLRRLTHAYFGLYVKSRVDNTLDNIERDLAKLYKDKEELEKKRECIKSAKFAKSTIIEECLRDASVLKHGIAGTGVLRVLP
nr:hypothetical protein CFP56_29294 [Quercus suber]